jgi:hypothetical protein
MLRDRVVVDSQSRSVETRDLVEENEPEKQQKRSTRRNSLDLKNEGQ